jgi:hypothetical protein
VDSIPDGVSAVRPREAQASCNHAKLRSVHISTVGQHPTRGGCTIKDEAQQAGLHSAWYRLTLQHQGWQEQRGSLRSKHHVQALGHTEHLAALWAHEGGCGGDQLLGTIVPLCHKAEVISIEDLTHRLWQSIPMIANIRAVLLQPRPQTTNIKGIQDRAQRAALLDTHTHREGGAVHTAILHRILQAAIHTHDGGQQPLGGGKAMLQTVDKHSVVNAVIRPGHIQQDNMQAPPIGTAALHHMLESKASKHGAPSRQETRCGCEGCLVHWLPQVLQ